MFVHNHNSTKGNSLRLYLSLALIATVASVPTSVLVQNSELASNAQQNRQNSNQIYNGISSINKVKRSSGLNKNEGQTSNKNSADSLMNKKSSPEIVPASYSAPPKPKSSIFGLKQHQDSMENAQSINNNNNNLEKNNDLISSAIAAGLTAAAVEAAAVAANQHELEQLRKHHQLYADDTDDQQSAAINKRGISAQHYGFNNMALPAESGYGNSAYNTAPSSAYYNPYGSYDAMSVANDVPQGVWSDDLDPANVVYTDIDDYAPITRVPSYRNKAYDNLQSILNSESYLEPAPAPAQLPYNNGRFYNSALDSERNKRAYKVFNQLASKFPDMRLKRDTKLTPADMLALVALVEAGERARKDTDTDAGYTMYPSENYVPKAYGINSNYNTGLYDYPSMGAGGGQVDDSLDYNNNGAWFEPQSMVDYYGVPMNMEPIPKYEIPQRENKYNDRLALFNNKHYMVAKKKRSIAKPTIPYKQDKLF